MVQLTREQVTNLEEVVQIVIEEYSRAASKFAPMHSAHEGYAVLKEEVDELWDAIKRNDSANMQEEAIQVAAMSIRFLVDVVYREDELK
jgi:NTP pyrophosphatase (non-canonical NTP hydrolase)